MPYKFNRSNITKMEIKFVNKFLSYSKWLKLISIVKKITRKYPIVIPFIPSMKFEPFFKTSKQKVTKIMLIKDIVSHWSKILIFV